MNKVFTTLRRWRDEREVRRLQTILETANEVRQQAVAWGEQHRNQSVPPSATEDSIVSQAECVADRWRERAQSELGPLVEQLSACRLAEQDKSFGQILLDLGGGIELENARACAEIDAARQALREAGNLLRDFRLAHRCHLVVLSLTKARLHLTAAVIIAAETVAAAGLFHERLRGGLWEASGTGAAIGIVQVALGIAAGWVWQATWGRGRLVRYAALGGIVMLALAFTLAVAYFRSSAALDLWSLLALAILGGTAVIQMSRTWLKFHGPVAGYRERYLWVVAAEKRVAAAESAAWARLNDLIQNAEARARDLLDRVREYLLRSMAIASQLGEVALRHRNVMHRIGNATRAVLTLFAELAGTVAGMPRRARNIPNFATPLKLAFDPQEFCEKIERGSSAVETESGEALRTIKRLGAAARSQLAKAIKAAAAGIDILQSNATGRTAAGLLGGGNDAP